MDRDVMSNARNRNTDELYICMHVCIYFQSSPANSENKYGRSFIYPACNALESEREVTKGEYHAGRWNNSVTIQ